MAVFEGKDYRTGKNIRIKTDKGFISSIDEAGESDLIIAPGLFDNQVNGYAGIGFSNPDLNVESIKTATESMQGIGVTSFLPTMITAPMKILLRNMEVFREALVEKQSSVSTLISSTIPGIHLEGPYISSKPGYRGAHNPDWIRKPNIREFDELYEASGENIIHVTLAPEIEGAIELIQHCRDLGVTVGLAHHNANTEQINAAVEAGAGLSIHLGNGLANTISRHINPLWPQLSNDSLSISLISDGFHLTKEEIRTFYKVKGKNKTILTSDCSYLAGLSPGSYDWHGKEVILETQGRIYFPEEKVLAGAASPLIRDIGIMMEYTGCTLPDAIDMASLNPARFHGIKDRGELAVGQRADLILFQIADSQIRLEQTIKGGRQV